MSHVMVTYPHGVFENLRRDSFAMLSEQPEARKAVVFIHGFAGHPFRTWSRIHELIAIDDSWKSTDAYFIGYDSTRDEVMLSAAYVANFLRIICPQPPDSLFRVTPRQSKFQLRGKSTKYETLELVGHSLGGVVLRAVILELLRRGVSTVGSDGTDLLPDTYSLPLNATLKLFAPAQGGARIAGLRGIATRSVGFRELVELYRGRSPSMQELEPGSQLLQALREDTNYFSSQYPELTALRAKIAWAHHDDVVTSLPYRHDVSYTIMQSNHLSVCKPTNQFRTPFVFVNSGTLSREDGAL